MTRDPVQQLVDQKAEDYLRAAVRFVRTWQLSDDPMSGILAIGNALDVLKVAHKDLDRQVKQSPRYYWRDSRNAADQAAAIWDQLSCHRPRCACQEHKVTHCPVHKDENPSFSVTVKNNRLLMHSFTGCSQTSVITALQQMGLWAAPRGGVR